LSKKDEQEATKTTEKDHGGLIATQNPQIFFTSCRRLGNPSGPDGGWRG